MTLVELLVVIMILGALAGTAMIASQRAGEEGFDAATRKSLFTLREASESYRNDVPTPMRRLADLMRPPAGVPLYSPQTRRGWRGPYVLAASGRYELTSEAEDAGFTSDYGDHMDPAVIDSWGRPIVLQIPDDDGVTDPSENQLRHARFVSAGFDGVLQTPAKTVDVDPPGTALLPSLTQCGDDLVLYLRVADTRPE